MTDGDLPNHDDRAERARELGMTPRTAWMFDPPAKRPKSSAAASIAKKRALDRQMGNKQLEFTVPEGLVDAVKSAVQATIDTEPPRTLSKPPLCHRRRCSELSAALVIGRAWARSACWRWCSRRTRSGFPSSA